MHPANATSVGQELSTALAPERMDRSGVCGDLAAPRPAGSDVRAGLRHGEGVGVGHQARRLVLTVCAGKKSFGVTSPPVASLILTIFSMLGYFKRLIHSEIADCDVSIISPNCARVIWCSNSHRWRGCMSFITAPYGAPVCLSTKNIR